MDINIIALDMVEALPAMDDSNTTANLAANIFCDFIAAFARCRQLAAKKA